VISTSADRQPHPPAPSQSLHGLAASLLAPDKAAFHHEAPGKLPAAIHAELRYALISLRIPAGT
jgi:hypothetical protein